MNLQFVQSTVNMRGQVQYLAVSMPLTYDGTLFSQKRCIAHCIKDQYLSDRLTDSVKVKQYHQNPNHRLLIISRPSDSDIEVDLHNSEIVQIVSDSTWTVLNPQWQGSTNCSILPSWMGEQEHGVSWKNIENMKNINHMTLHLWLKQ